MNALLRVQGLRASYGPTEALHGLDFEVGEGGITALLGANGAGKTTTLRAVCGMVRTQGSIGFAGQPIASKSTEDIVRLGIFQVMEGRRVFEHLTVEENLIAGGYTSRNGGNHSRDLAMVYDYFPQLKARAHQTAGYLSGGEQQMLAIGRALMAKPKLMMLDEPSLGLAPILVREIFGIVKRINAEQGTTILLVEQNANLTLSVADYAYIMENGRIVLAGYPADLRENADVSEFYLGLTDVGQRKSYRDVKHYKRRKRWLS